MSTFLKKLSLAKMGCDAKKVRDSKYKDKGPQPIANISGRAVEVVTGERRDTGEPFTALKGKFVAKRTQSKDDTGVEPGEVFESGMCFLPGGLQDLVEGTLAGSDAAGVDFAFEILAAQDETNIGYHYVGRNLKPPTVADDMEPLRRLIGIEAPKQEEPPVDKAPIEISSKQPEAPAPEQPQPPPAQEPPVEQPKQAASGGRRR